jgi:osmoprotectant transport system ATP-binding protein
VDKSIEKRRFNFSVFGPKSIPLRIESFGVAHYEISRPAGAPMISPAIKFCFQRGRERKEGLRIAELKLEGTERRAMSTAIEFRKLSFAVQGADSRVRLLLDNISLALEEGTSTAILGRSGSGKTTLLRTVNRMVEPTSGDVLIHGKNMRNHNLIAMRRTMGYVIQETGLFPHFTVERNVGVVLEAEGRPREERMRRSHELLQTVGLDPASFVNRYPHQLSGGQRQRVGLARALAAEPGILLMDEPFGALDPLTRAEMQDMLLKLLNNLKKTVLLVTHDLDEALYLAHRVVLMSEGRLIANLDPAEFLRSRQPEVEAYVRATHRGSRNSTPEVRP